MQFQSVTQYALSCAKDAPCGVQVILMLRSGGAWYLVLFSSSTSSHRRRHQSDLVAQKLHNLWRTLLRRPESYNFQLQCSTRDV